MAAQSMYALLLDAALARADGSGDELSTGGALAELLRCRGRLGPSPTSKDDAAPGAAAAVADQVAYDVSLVRLSRLVGIECDVDRFDRPEIERRRLEAELVASGIDLAELEGSQESAPPDRA